MKLGTKSLLSLGLLASPLINAATVTSSWGPSQSSAIESGWSSYYAAFITGTQVAHVLSELATILPEAEYTSVVENYDDFFFAVRPGDEDIFDFATQPPVSFTSTPTWVATLPAKVKNDVLALQTELIEADASIARKVLKISAAPALGLQGVEWVFGAVAAIVGVVAVVL